MSCGWFPTGSVRRVRSASSARAISPRGPRLASYDANIVKDATYAVTVEPAGGSPDGKPTLPPVFAGKLIETVPQAGALSFSVTGAAQRRRPSQAVRY